MIVIDQGVRTLSAAAALMERHELGTQDSYEQRSKVRSVEQSTADMLAKIEARLASLEEKQNQRPQSKTVKNTKDIECYRCHKRGHYASECKMSAFSGQDGNRRSGNDQPSHIQ
jgi:poly(3-hydroxybutyrate) depolymerase